MRGRRFSRSVNVLVECAMALLRYIIVNWPDFFLLALAFAGSCAVMFLPLNLWLRLALVPVAAGAALGLWMAIVWLIIWILWPR